MFDSLRKKISNAISSIVKSENEEEANNLGNEKANSDIENNIQPISEETGTDKPTEDESPPDYSIAQKSNESENRQSVKGNPEKQVQNNEKGKDIKLSLSTRLKSAFSKEIKLNDNDIERFSSELMMTMLQSDVSYATTEKFIESLKTQMSNTRFESSNLQSGISNCVSLELEKVLEAGKPKEQLLEIVRHKLDSGMRPVSIMFLGPNGTGKTTTMSKIAYMLKNNGISSVFSASDTFRAAAIEQTAYHASKLGMPIIKGAYGADPASIAFDAIEYTKAHGLDVVLIDTAGRQETNKNLLNEIKKMERVAKPDITIYVGESTSGNRIAEQIAEFVKFIKIDGIILTKLDCDSKGGNAISISDVTGIPIFFFGTGESYDSLMEFDPSFIIKSIVQN